MIRQTAQHAYTIGWMAVGVHDTGINGLQRMRQCFVITSCSNPQKQAPVTPPRTPYPSAAALALLGAAVLSSMTGIAAEGLSVSKLRCCDRVCAAAAAATVSVPGIVACTTWVAAVVCVLGGSCWCVAGCSWLLC